MDGLVEWQSATPIPSLAKRQKDPEWERKQRQREYRVAARREKRNRKADEKKQRKLNATILRRMTRNPEKYTKNAERNRLRAITAERHKIWLQAVRQAERLAAEHDPTGRSFNVGPVTRREDGTVVSVEAQRRREERLAGGVAVNGESHGMPPPNAIEDSAVARSMGLPQAGYFRKLSKTQQRKLAALQPRPPPPKPVLPEGVSVPDGEENWIELWDLSDEGLERRVNREKKKKAADRKALRLKQQSGKTERRAARDEKRKVYRDLKMTWKVIKEEEKRHKTRMKIVELQEEKRLAVAISNHQRQQALDCCAEFGCTLENTEGVEEIKPVAMGMKGQTVDFELLSKEELAAPRESIGSQPGQAKKSSRVDLSGIAALPTKRIVGGDYYHHDDGSGRPEKAGQDFISLDDDGGDPHEALNFNHRLRRKLLRAMEAAQIKKELHVRERVREMCRERGIDPAPAVLDTPAKPVHRRGERMLETGVLESAKAERVRARLDLAEFNRAARVLRAQAKRIAMEAGLRVYAEMTGRIPPREEDGADGRPPDYGPGWHVAEPPKAEDNLKKDELTIL